MTITATSRSDPLDRESPVPLFTQIADRLQDDIETQRMPPGARLPSEAVIAERYGVSRMTARKAVLQLTAKGFVYRRERSGTFVAPPRLDHVISTESSFSASMRAAGHEVTTEVLRAGLQPASVTSAAVLGIAPGEPLLDIRRLRLVDGERVAIHETRLATRFAAVLGHDLTGSLTEILRDVGAGSVRAKDSIDAVNADAETAVLLDVPEGWPLMRVEGVGYGSDGDAVRHTLSVFRGDRFRFGVTGGEVPFDIQLLPG